MNFAVVAIHALPFMYASKVTDDLEQVLTSDEYIWLIATIGD